MSKSWYSIRAASGADAPTIAIDDEIGFWGITAKSFLADAKSKLGDSPEFNLEINTPGGDVYAGVAIANGLRALGKKINVKVMGIAASMGSYIAMFGDHVSMPDNTFMFVHNPITGRYGNAEDLRDAAAELDKVAGVMIPAYAKRYKGKPEELQALLDNETLLTAQECLEAGFCDEVTPAMEAVACWDAEKAPEPVRAVYAKFAKAAGGSVPAVSPPAAPAALAPSDIKVLADKHGVAEFVGVFALLPDLSPGAVEAAVTEAAQIKALAAMFDGEKPGDYIKARKTYAEVRAAIAERQAAADPSIDSTPPANPTAPAPAGLMPHADLWKQIEANQRSK